MIIAMVEYVNKNGRIAVKGFSTEDGLNDFVKRLEKRGVQYLLTRI